MKPRTSVALFSCLGLLVGVGPTAAQQVPRLPAAPKPLQDRPTNIVLRLSEGGTPSINSQPVEWTRLNAELGAIYDKRPEKVLFVELTPRTRTEHIRRVVALAKRHGIRVYGYPGPSRS